MCAKRAYKALFFTICENIISNWLCKIFRLIYVRYAGFPRSLRSLGMTKGRFGFVFPLVIARNNECCDVAIKATAAFRYAGFPRSLCSLGMTYGRFGFVFPLACCKARAHQADNLAKLRFDFLSVPRLIAQILCAVSRAINRARLSAIRTLACCRCLSDDFCSYSIKLS